jgi:hypothetical protein
MNDWLQKLELENLFKFGCQGGGCKTEMEREEENERRRVKGG